MTSCATASSDGIVKPKEASNNAPAQFFSTFVADLIRCCDNSLSFIADHAMRASAISTNVTVIAPPIRVAI